MDLIHRLLLSAFFAMVTMTGFSYAVSSAFRKLYKEPVLLTYFLKELHLTVSKPLQHLLAWTLHYLIGLGFVIGYHLLWQYRLLPLTWGVGFLLGTVSGIVGIIGWIFIFSYTKHEPKIDFKGYYIQLLLAHIIFGVTAYVAYVYLY
ncbi:hypothetical protein [Flavobacterium sp. SM2513]|uniref:hypothetical protein n=1 Tax=Flavobacterium sp. SM2513 TaxID=3424766 RepID=UPI003D7FF073